MVRGSARECEGKRVVVVGVRASGRGGRGGRGGRA